MERNAYSAGAVKFSFWFIEFKKAVSLLASGINMKEIKAKNAAENLFAASSADRAKMVMNTVYLDDGVKVNYMKVQTAKDGKVLPLLAKI